MNAHMQAMCMQGCNWGAVMIVRMSDYSLSDVLN